MANNNITYLHSIATEKVNIQTQHIDTLSGIEIAELMNSQDVTTIQAVQQATPAIGQAIEKIAQAFLQGGRLIYIGAGTSGRLGVLDASECPPTFGVDSDMVIGLIAGGDFALRNAVEGAEDSQTLSVRDLQSIQLSNKDVVVAISASGFAPYCVAGLQYAKQVGATTISLCCNQNAHLSQFADIAIEAPTGAEVLTGSTRLKAGTATKMVLNMLSTGAMIRIGKSYKNLMVDLKPSNDKLKDRSIRLLRHAVDIPEHEAELLYQQAGGNIKRAIVMYNTSCTQEQAALALTQANGFVAKAIKSLQ